MEHLVFSQILEINLSVHACCGHEVAVKVEGNGNHGAMVIEHGDERFDARRLQHGDYLVGLVLAHDAIERVEFHAVGRRIK